MDKNTKYNLRLSSELFTKIELFMNEQQVKYNDNFEVVEAKDPMVFLKQVDDLFEEYCDELSNLDHLVETI